MLRWSRIVPVLVVCSLAWGCGARQPATPIDTFKTYVKAIKAKDTDTMRLLLSDATLKMHEQEARSQGVKLDDILMREPLYSDGQRTVEFKNEKIDGEKATLQVKNPYGSWQTVHFVFENGAWRIDKQAYADDLIQQVEDSNQRIDDLINGNTDSGIEPGQLPPVETGTNANTEPGPSPSEEPSPGP